MVTSHAGNAVLDGMHPTWSSRLPVIAPLLRLPIRIASFYHPMAAESDVLISNEACELSDEGDAFAWRWHDPERGVVSGRARWVIGTPYVASPRALLVPYFYWSWPTTVATTTPRERGVSFIARNVRSGTLAPRRLALAVALSRYMPVHTLEALRVHFPASSQAVFHELAPGPEAKRAFLARFTFNLACENEARPGYITEKPLDALLAGAVPLYAGAPDVRDWFDADGFVDVSHLELDATLASIAEAEAGGMPGHVQHQRDRLVRVPYEAMMARIWNFVATVHDDLYARGELADFAGRERGMRLEVARPRQRRIQRMLSEAHALARPLLSRLPVGLEQRIERAIYAAWHRL